MLYQTCSNTIQHVENGGQTIKCWFTQHLKTRQCWSAVSVQIVCGAALRLFQGPSIFTALLWWSSHFACVVFACACVKAFLFPALPSLWMGVGKKFPLRFSVFRCLVGDAHRVVLVTFTLACGFLSLLKHLPHTHLLTIALKQQRQTKKRSRTSVTFSSLA